MNKRPGVILDRDGTLIDFVRVEELGAVVSAFHPDHIRFLPGVVEGLLGLQDAGFSLCVATNQPGAAKGQVKLSAIERTNQALVDRLAEHGIRIEAVASCLHHPDGGPGGDPTLATSCTCRKPRPGMLLNLMASLNLDPERTWMIGDAPVDVMAARAAGIKAALLFESGRCEMCPLRGGLDDLPLVRPDAAASRIDHLVGTLRDSLAEREA